MEVLPEDKPTITNPNEDNIEYLNNKMSLYTLRFYPRVISILFNLQSTYLILKGINLRWNSSKMYYEIFM